MPAILMIVALSADGAVKQVKPATRAQMESSAVTRFISLPPDCGKDCPSPGHADAARHGLYAALMALIQYFSYSSSVYFRQLSYKKHVIVIKKSKINSPLSA